MSNNDQLINIHSDKLDLDFSVFVQNETTATQQKCFILTVQDIGSDHTGFKELIDLPDMIDLKERIIWLHVNLPGQEANAKELKLTRYPSMQDLANELILVFDYFGIQQAICFGEGAGANLCLRFAMLHQSRCLGIVAVNPTSSSGTLINGFVETFKDKLSIRRSSKTNNSLNQSNLEFLSFHRLGQNPGTAKMAELKAKLGRYNQKNLSLFIDAYLNRTSIAEKISEITVDVLTISGKKASLANDTKKFYKLLETTRRKNIKSLVNSPILEVENASDVICDKPSKIIASLQYFLQGIGLLSAIPIERGIKNSRKLSITMQEADKPRRVSIW